VRWILARDGDPDQRYANRKLYNTESSRYITLRGISELVREGHDICVIDNETGEEITPIVLSQNPRRRSEGESRSRRGRSRALVLAELIQRGGDALYSLVRRGVGDVETNLNEMRDNVKRWIKNTRRDREVRHRRPRETVHSAWSACCASRICRPAAISRR